MPNIIVPMCKGLIHSCAVAAHFTSEIWNPLAHYPLRVEQSQKWPNSLFCVTIFYTKECLGIFNLHVCPSTNKWPIKNYPLWSVMSNNIPSNGVWCIDTWKSNHHFLERLSAFVFSHCFFFFFSIVPALFFCLP